MKQIILKGLGLVAGLCLTMIACKKDATSASVDSQNYTEIAVYEMQSQCALGKMGCYELVFPITIQFPDQTQLTANSYEELKTGIKAWREANENVVGRPEFVFPFSIINQAGETILVENHDQLKTLNDACPDARRHGPKGHFERGLNCFELVFPVTIVFPDASEKLVNTQEELKAALIAWRKSDPTTKGHPTLKFPLTVTLKSDGTSVTVNNREELIALKKSCRG